MPGPGAVIEGQNGTIVRYRKKCTTCGTLDRSSNAIPIVRGTMRSNFFSPKCRRRRTVELQGR